MSEVQILLWAGQGSLEKHSRHPGGDVQVAGTAWG